MDFRATCRAILKPPYRHRATVDLDGFAATWTTGVELKAGEKYANKLIALFTSREGKVVRYDEYFNPRRFAEAPRQADSVTHSRSALGE